MQMMAQDIQLAVANFSQRSDESQQSCLAAAAGAGQQNDLPGTYFHVNVKQNLLLQVSFAEREIYVPRRDRRSRLEHYRGRLNGHVVSFINHYSVQVFEIEAREVVTAIRLTASRRRLRLF
jgi:hypothetical protein